MGSNCRVRDQPAVAHCHVDHTHQECVARLRAVASRLGLFERGSQPAEFALRHGYHDLILGPELVINGRFRDTDRIGDHLQ